MSDAFYFCLRNFGYHVFWASSRPTILHRDRVPPRPEWVPAYARGRAAFERGLTGRRPG